MAEAVVTILLVLFVAFLLLRNLGDPAQLLMAERGSAESNQELRRRAGLDDSGPAQYLRFLGRAAQGDLGHSYRSGIPVAELLAERLPASLELVCCATLLTALLAIPLGILTAEQRGSWLDSIVQLASLGGSSMPTFLTGMLLIAVAAVSFPLLPASGREDGWRSLVLPSLTLALFQWALFQRLIRAQMIEALRSGYIVSARVRGLGRVAILRHAFRNAIVPVLAVAGTQFGTLLAYSVATETVFQWPGLGSLFIHAVRNADFPVIAGYLLLVSALFVAVNFGADVAGTLSDPRLRYPADGRRAR